MSKIKSGIYDFKFLTPNGAYKSGGFDDISEVVVEWLMENNDRKRYVVFGCVAGAKRVIARRTLIFLRVYDYDISSQLLLELGIFDNYEHFKRTK